jgi:serine/threonine protein kinase
MIGERIGHLRVIESIGVGGMGAVWHAVDELLDRHVALKVIRPELLSRPGLAERFRSEAIVLARLQHPCIAALYGLEKRGDEFVMVMEYVDGRTLDSMLVKHTTFPWHEASRITRAVLDALDHAHDSGVVHRDIKPANIMLTRAGRVKVMDFGIARLVGAQRQTRTGAAVGTPSYMSPEQLLGQEVDGRADVYAVGTLLYELATGHLPFEVEGDYLRMIAQLQEVPKPPSTHNPELPAGLDAIVARALEKEQGDRYATAGDFRDALEELERAHGVWRPYGTPAAGSLTITGSNPTVPGTPAAGVAPDAAPAGWSNANSSALLTPVESAMSLTPVPFSIDPANATPLDLSVPSEYAGAAAASAPEPVAAQSAQAVVAERVTAASSSLHEPIAPAASTRRGPTLAIAGVALAALAFGASRMVGRNNEAPPATPPTVAVAPAQSVDPAPQPIAPATPASADSVCTGRTARSGRFIACRPRFDRQSIGADQSVRIPRRERTIGGRSAFCTRRGPSRC